MVDFLYPKPKFIEPITNSGVSASSGAPPYLFRDVTVRVFPLKASMATLTSFCDAYLNMDVPPEIVHFSPSMPCVFLMIMNYGRMSMASVAAQNLGWVSQHEITFSVPLQQWRLVNNNLVFQDWAEVSPFIYVDDQFSLNNGRETYGWNKVSAYIDAEVPLWAGDPRAKLRQFDLSIVDFEKSYAGEDNVRRKLLEIDLDPPPALVRFPIDTRDPWSPIWAIPSAISNAAALANGAFELAMSSRLRGYQANQRLDGLLQMAGRAAGMLKIALPSMLGSVGAAPTHEDLIGALQSKPDLLSSQITLKQFRSAEDPSLACYQGLINSKMGLDRLNRAGLLGDVNYLRGDSSGGYTVFIHETDAQPIISTLGIEVADRVRADGGGSIATVKPVLPFWLDADLYYSDGEVICSRTHGVSTDPPGRWEPGGAPSAEPLRPKGSPENGPPENGPPENGPSDSVPPGSMPLPSSAAPRKPTNKPLYNTTLGAAVQAIVGPFHFPDVTLQVYPLLADPALLQRYMDSKLNEPLKQGGMCSIDEIRMNGNWKFKSFGSYVYMVVTTYGSEKGVMWSGSDNIGTFFSREVSFCIPVKWYDENDKLVTVAMIEPFIYSNDGRAVATDREVNGYNTIRASIDSPADSWLAPGGPIAPRSYLHLETEVIPALNVGERARLRTLIDIDSGAADSSVEMGLSSESVETWHRELVDDLKRKSYIASVKQSELENVGALSVEILGNGAPINRIVTKQYRDSADLDRACYQALIHLTSCISTIYDMREIETRPLVRMHRHPGHEIVDTLGLKIKSRHSAGGEVVDTLEPIRPFWARLAMSEDLGTVACYRQSDAEWRVTHPWFLAGESPGPADSPASPIAATSAGARPSPHEAAEPPRRLAGRRPYFREFWTTAVGRAIAPAPGEPAPRVGLKGDAARWLRNSLTNDLAWLRVHCEVGELAGPVLETLKTELMAWDRGAPSDEASQQLKWRLGDAFPLAGLGPGLDGLLTADVVADFCDGHRVDELSALLHGLHAFIGAILGRDIPPPAPPAGAASGLPPTDPLVTEFVNDLHQLIAWLGGLCKDADDESTAESLVFSYESLLRAFGVVDGLEQFRVEFLSLPTLNQKTMLTVFPKAVRKVLSDLGRFKVPALDRKPSENLEALFDNLARVMENVSRAEILKNFCENAILPWSDPDRWLRIFHHGDDGVADASNAAAAVDSLDEVQLVLDRILSARWENRGGGGPMPGEFVRVGGDFIDAGAATARGLKAWAGGDGGATSQYWVVPDGDNGARDGLMRSRAPAPATRAD